MKDSLKETLKENAEKSKFRKFSNLVLVSTVAILVGTTILKFVFLSKYNKGDELKAFNNMKSEAMEDRIKYSWG